MRLPISILLIVLIYVFSAYKLYADPKSGGRPVSSVGFQDTDSQEHPTMAGRFKKTFSNENVKVHFVSAWSVIQHVTTENQND